MLRSELDPVEIRQELEVQRARGVSFDEAWKVATRHRTQSVDDQYIYVFMRKHFEAAYNNDESPRGRCMVPARDTSSAVPSRLFTSYAEPEILKVSHDHERCRSGDGCDRLATQGRFGKMWCERHGAELERLSIVLGNDRAQRDPS